MPCTIIGPGNTEVNKTTLPTLVKLNVLIWGDRKKVEISGLASKTPNAMKKIKQGKMLKDY